MDTKAEQLGADWKVYLQNKALELSSIMDENGNVVGVQQFGGKAAKKIACQMDVYISTGGQHDKFSDKRGEQIRKEIEKHFKPSLESIEHVGTFHAGHGLLRIVWEVYKEENPDGLRQAAILNAMTWIESKFDDGGVLSFEMPFTQCEILRIKHPERKIRAMKGRRR